MAHQLERTLALLESLTAQGRASWQESARPAEYLLPLDGFVVMLSKNPYTELFSLNQKVEGPFRLSLLAEGGSEIATLEARQGEALFDRMRRLFGDAGQRAKRLPDVIETVERQLQSLT